MSAKYVPISLVCEHYSMSERAIRRYIADGKLTAYRVGPKMIRLDAEQVEREQRWPVNRRYG